MRKSILIIALAACLVSMQVWVPSSHADLIGPDGEAMIHYPGGWRTINQFGGISHIGSWTGAFSDYLVAFNDSASSIYSTANLKWTGTGQVALSFDYLFTGTDALVRWGDADGVINTITGFDGLQGHFSGTYPFVGRFVMEVYALGDSYVYISDISASSVSTVPEPSTLLLLGGGLAGLVGYGRRRMKK